jgi:uncharacterized membrane protein YfcA
MNAIWYILAGLFSGIIAGMGMGGGTLLIPVLTLLLGMGQYAAQGVNMLAFLPAAAAALYIHIRAGRVNIKRSLPILAGGIAGAALGALAARWLQADMLKRAFGVFLILLGLLQWVQSGNNKAPKG